EIANRMGCADPSGKNAVAGEAHLESRVGEDEGFCFAPLLIHEGGLAELEIMAGLTIDGDAAAGRAASLVVEDFIVAEPQLEGKIRAQRNKAMEDGIVADGPG